MTTTKTDTFSFAGLELRCVTLEGPGPITVDGKGQAKRSEEPWFVAADVCRCLGLDTEGGTSKHLTGLDDGDRKTLRLIGGNRGNPLKVVISEAGLYRLVMRSDKPQARTFQDFVTGTVLPTIRKTGGYIQGEEKLATGEMTDEQFFALAVLKANTTIELMKAKNAEQRVEIERQAKIIREELEHGTIREFSSKAGMYLKHGQSVKMGQLASEYCRTKKIAIQKKMMTLDGRRVPVNIYPREAFEYARLMTM